jgi:hypothetical protein
MVPIFASPRDNGGGFREVPLLTALGLRIPAKRPPTCVEPLLHPAAGGAARRCG